MYIVPLLWPETVSCHNNASRSPDVNTRRLHPSDSYTDTTLARRNQTPVPPPDWRAAVKPVANTIRQRIPTLALIAATGVSGPAPWAQDDPVAVLQGAEQRAVALDEARAFAADAEIARVQRLDAEQGDADAQLRLGRQYFVGKGVPHDEVEGVRWVRLAAEQGHPEAQSVLATAYSLGRGVSEDQAEAARWYRLAAEQGHVQAQTSLGSRYSAGKGVLKDTVEAVRWYRLAAEKGHRLAQLLLANTYRDDEVVRDRVLAHMWFNVFNANGGGLPPDIWGVFERSMTREEILRATELARECMDSNYQSCDP